MTHGSELKFSKVFAVELNQFSVWDDGRKTNERKRSDASEGSHLGIDIHQYVMINVNSNIRIY